MKIVNIILAIVLLVVGIIMGIIIKSWNGINWDYIEYGNLADWVSGIGTIAALSSSVVFFIFSNRPSLKFKLVRSEYNNDITVFIANNGRVPGAYEFLGMRILRDDSFFRFTSFKEYICISLEYVRINYV